uniref:ParB/Sulfiredoxin domain-containing protein n=1 Tax=viral metagenome TaxID=1070528 RepID=A0A6C0F036_9ZZZZ
MRDSVSTSVSIKLFENKQDARLAHILKSKLVEIPLSMFANNGVENFNSDRLKDSAVKAYPLDDRPRGNVDISSVEYHQSQIKQQNDIDPIWLVYKNNKYLLLDGAHRIVASYIEGVEFIRAYVIYI